ncbi:Retrovirus-related Pol polyprotein LINE-1 [Cricetulus griseus]|uniref:Retrovirus-related Pol polyprotein LINE-1 n=1 Tax=Cricetulus griseus TaxID=10029 RepID=G3HQE7_CRIGR|nr:Retrovirus-related Pol polyprotein LINE-1 [Cricetulus griseus]
MTAHGLGKDIHHIRQRVDLQNIPRTQEASLQNTKQSNKKWGTELNRQFSIEESKMAERHIRKCSTSLAIREMQIKTTLCLIFFTLIFHICVSGTSAISQSLVSALLNVPSVHSQVSIIPAWIHFSYFFFPMVNIL